MSIPSLTVHTPPAREILSITEAVDHLNGNVADDQIELLQTLIITAREACELQTGRTLPLTTLRLTMDEWPDSGIITLPAPPLVSVTSITYLDEDGVTQTVDPASYRVDPHSTPGRIIPVSSAFRWPSLGSAYSGATVTFVAGYEAVPSHAKAAAKLLVGHLFENREAASEKTASEVPLAFRHVLQSLTVRSYP